jgi:hypothetical protein
VNRTFPVGPWPDGRRILPGARAVRRSVRHDGSPAELAVFNGPALGDVPSGVPRESHRALRLGTWSGDADPGSMSRQRQRAAAVLERDGCGGPGGSDDRRRGRIRSGAARQLLCAKNDAQRPPQ